MNSNLGCGGYCKTSVHVAGQLFIFKKMIVSANAISCPNSLGGRINKEG